MKVRKLYLSLENVWERLMALEDSISIKELQKIKKTGLQVQFVAKDNPSAGLRFSLQLAAKITDAAQFCF